MAKNIVLFTLSGENIDTFDYLTDQPSRLIMDFYVNPNGKPKNDSVAKTLPAKVETNKPEEAAKLPKVAAKIKTGKSRKPATADILTIANQGVGVAQNDGAKSGGIVDGGDPDYERFSIKDYEIKEDAMIRAKDNYYIPFPMLETPVSYWEKLKVTPTIYQISSQNTDENKQARLLLTLFEKQRYAIYLKTQAWFKEKYPESQYHEAIDFMTADVHLALWQAEGRSANYDEAVQEYKEAIEKYPKSPWRNARL